MDEKEVSNGFLINCEGVIPKKGNLAPLVEHPTQATVTIYKDGSRDIGCPYLIRPYGTCSAMQLDESWHPNYKKSKCIHLFPVDSTKTKVPTPMGFV